MDVQKFELCEGPVESIEFPPGSVDVYKRQVLEGRQGEQMDEAEAEEEVAAAE